MNRYRIHERRFNLTWIDVRAGQIWGWKTAPEDVSRFIKIHSKRGGLWHLTDSTDISERVLLRDYTMLHELEP